LLVVTGSPTSLRRLIVTAAGDLNGAFYKGGGSGAGFGPNRIVGQP
jgi:hypothetical protein